MDVYAKRLRIVNTLGWSTGSEGGESYVTIDA